ncbi:MAG: glucose-6-phosphate isomerase [Rhodobacteraceae bacterium]|nr:glucose-6-phosphate isomerase [Paracoccaceae bacterium]
MTDPWAALAEYHRKTANRRILSLFDDKARFADFSAETDGLLLDYSKTNIDRDGLKLLLDLARATGVLARRDRMFQGDAINETEDRAALHTALRSRSDQPVMIEGRDVLPPLRLMRKRMYAFAEDLRSGRLKTAGGGLFRNVVNIGIGGSDLGPRMAVQALAPYHDGPRLHFVANIDGAEISDILKPLDPGQTLIVIASKTFTTVETMTNAGTAIAWLRRAMGEQATRHLAAVSSALDRTAALGIDPAQVFAFEDWVGGRYSLWGPVGLPIVLAIGAKNFDGFLDGAAAMDRHFLTADPERNLPLLLGLTGIWHNNICGFQTRAILPYDQRLARLPAYLQQLEMESNGKCVALDGSPLVRDSAPVVWGEPGTGGQHAFYQLLHQGTRIVPAEFLIAATGHEADLAHHHNLLKANCLAQSEALMRGRDRAAAEAIAAGLGYQGAELSRQAAHRVFPGNRPSLTLAYRQLTPFVLGQIIALYEHRVFVEGAVWGINSFDQWGVELGKKLADEILLMLNRDKIDTNRDSSTLGLLGWLGGKE